MAVGRQRADGGSGAAEADAKDGWMPQRERLFEPWDKFLPRGLVPPIPDGLLPILVATALERAHEEQGSLQVEHGIFQRDRRRQDFSGLRCLQFGGRRRDDELEIVRPAPGTRIDLTILKLTAQREATEEGRGSVVGMALDL